MNTYLRFSRWARGLAILAVLVLVASWGVYFWASANSVLAQRIEPHDALTAELLGEPGLLIGSPQQLVITDAGAFVEGEGPGGARLVSEAYLKANNLYPLQLKTVEFFRNAFSIAAVLGGLLMLGLSAWLERLGKRAAAKPASAR